MDDEVDKGALGRKKNTRQYFSQPLYMYLNPSYSVE